MSTLEANIRRAGELEQLLLSGSGKSFSDRGANENRPRNDRFGEVFLVIGNLYSAAITPISSHP